VIKTEPIKCCDDEAIKTIATLANIVMKKLPELIEHCDDEYTKPPVCCVQSTI
jgi:hypothetical protein